MFLNVAQFVSVTQAEGPGKRFGLWLQGCPLNCPGCCNPEMIPFSGGKQTSIIDLTNIIQQVHHQYGIEGITIMGGEPFSQTEGLALLTAQVQSIGLSVMIFSGYTLKELHAQNSSATEQVLQQTDILVDGRYEASQPDHSRRWIGSQNQQLHFLSNRYTATDACWKDADTLEIRWENGEISLNGFPAKKLAPLWTGRGLTSGNDQELKGHDAE